MVQAVNVSDGPIRSTPSVADGAVAPDDSDSGRGPPGSALSVEPGTPDPPSDPHPPKVARTMLETRAMM